MGRTPSTSMLFCAILHVCLCQVCNGEIPTKLNGYSSVKVYNDINSEVEVMIKNGWQSLGFGPQSSKTTTEYKNVPAIDKWNITMQSKNQEFMLKQDIQFEMGKNIMIVVHKSSSSKVDALLLDANQLQHKKESNATKVPGVDQALLVVTSEFRNLRVSWRSENCYQCLYQELLTVKEWNLSSSTLIDTKWPVNLIFPVNGSVSQSCNISTHYGEHGEYQVYVKGSGLCEFTTIKEPGKTYTPIAVMFGIIAGLIILFLVFKNTCWKSYTRKKEYELSQELGKPRNFLSSGNANISVASSSVVEGDQTPSPSKGKTRLKSLDAFRGVAITIMIFVNYGGGGYHFFEHSLWNGLTVADLVFPWFIFIMGTSIDLSQRSLLSKGIRKQTVFKKIFVRSLKLFAIGLFLNNGADLEKWRIPGVLQRFAVSYFVVAAVSLLMSPSEEAQDVKRRFDWTDQFREYWLFWTQWVLMFCLLAVYLMVTFLLHENGCPRGFIGPGGIGDDGKYPNCTGGAAGYIDRKIFGSNHMYNHPTCKKLYKTNVPYDPEGILGCLTSIFLTYLGLHSGRILFTHSAPYARIVRWLICAVFWGCIAIGLAGGTQNEGVIPINKNLWSPSFIFATASLAYILLTFMFFVIDVKKWWDGGPFTFAGMNAIFLYCGHEVFHKFFPFNFVADPPTHAKLLTRSAVGTAVWLVIAFYLYTEKMFFKV